LDWRGAVNPWSRLSFNRQQARQVDGGLLTDFGAVLGDPGVRSASADLETYHPSAPVLALDACGFRHLRTSTPMQTAAEYRKQAEEARRLARSAASPPMREVMEDMARTWDQLAAEREAQLAARRIDP